jgi:hypothetical protein
MEHRSRRTEMGVCIPIAGSHASEVGKIISRVTGRPEKPPVATMDAALAAFVVSLRPTWM